MSETKSEDAPPSRQYIGIKFRPQDRRVYTYHNDGEPCEVGEIVKIATREGWQRVEVVAVNLEKPPFDTKPIAGKLPPPELKSQYEGPTDGAD